MEVDVNVKEDWTLINEMVDNRAFTEEYVSLKWWGGKIDKHGNPYTYMIVRAPEMDKKELKKIVLQDIKRYKNKIKKQEPMKKKTRKTVTKKTTNMKKTTKNSIKKTTKKATKQEALNSCGRLKKGFKFLKGGALVKVVKMKEKKTTTTRRKK